LDDYMPNDTRQNEPSRSSRKTDSFYPSTAREARLHNVRDAQRARFEKIATDKFNSNIRRKLFLIVVCVIVPLVIAFFLTAKFTNIVHLGFGPIKMLA
jgi:hypothetical protein